jgi:hypothetical protein
VIDLREEPANALDVMRVNSESVLDEISERNKQSEKHDEQRI